MNGWMSECVDGWRMDEWMDGGWMNGWMLSEWWIDKWMDECINKYTSLNMFQYLNNGSRNRLFHKVVSFTFIFFFFLHNFEKCVDSNVFLYVIIALYFSTWRHSLPLPSSVLLLDVPLKMAPRSFASNCKPFSAISCAVQQIIPATFVLTILNVKLNDPG